MVNHRLCSIFLNFKDRLTNSDRERLHSYLQYDVPESSEDDLSLNMTLKLMQSLFDQDAINEKDFTLLIDGFQQIQCFDAVRLLHEHQRQIQSAGLDQSRQSLVSIMPPHIYEFLCNNEDDDPYLTAIEDQVDYRNKNNNYTVIDGKDVSINEDAPKISFPPKPYSRVRLLKRKRLIFPLILLVLISMLVILIVMLIGRNNRIQNLESNLRMKEMFIVEAENQSNQTMKHFSKEIAKLKKQNNETMQQLNDHLIEKNATMKNPNKTSIECKTERKTSLIKAGRIFGGDDGEDFDDSSSLRFTSSHYFNGFILSHIDVFDACQFIYTSSHDNQSRIESPVHGSNGNKINSTHTYSFGPDERIREVKVKSYYKVFMNNRQNSKIIRGLQFITTKGQKLPPEIALMGYNVESESFPGYTLGYVTGKSASRVDQLQFVWYRTEQ